MEVEQGGWNETGSLKLSIITRHRLPSEKLETFPAESGVSKLLHLHFDIFA